MKDNSAAFEYVGGTLTPAERAEFQQRLANEPELQRAVQFWQEQLMALQDEDQRLAPEPAGWDKIAARLGPEPAQATSSAVPGLFAKLFRWYLPALASALLLLAVAIQWLVPTRTVPNTDYVAVLVAPAGKVKLTALTTGANQTLWLQWENIQIPSGKSLQIWASSRRDGMIRPVAVIDQLTTQQIPLDQAGWRLIRDAHELWLTEEEEGGSPFDEPSEQLIAKGICVRFTPPG